MIEKVMKGCIARNKKLNEVIGELNPLLNIEVELLDYVDIPSVRYSDNNVIITLPDSSVLSEYDEEVFDVVESGNVAGQRYFLTKPV